MGVLGRGGRWLGWIYGEEEKIRLLRVGASEGREAREEAARVACLEEVEPCGVKF